MRSTYYSGVCTKPGTYYQGWLMYMRYTQGQNEEYLLFRNTVLPLKIRESNFRQGSLILPPSTSKNSNFAQL